MKKIILLIALLSGLTACYHEDELNVPDLSDKYGVLQDSSDPTQHFIYEFYQKYESVIIVNPTIADYKFNFNAENGIQITAPEQTQAVIDEGVDFLKKALIDLYPSDFLKKNLPFSIILAEKVQMDSYGETTVLSSYASNSFIAISNITSALGSMSKSDFVKMRADLNANFWAKYMSEVRGSFSIPDEFYELTETAAEDKEIYSGYYYMGYEAPSTIDFYKYGLISYNTESSYIDP